VIHLLGAVLVASLVGSLHCASMCGPFVALALLRNGGQRDWRLQPLYHGGRLLAYLVLGAVAGGIGASVDFGASVLGIGRVAGVLTGLALVAIGARRILAIAGWRTPAVPGANALARLLGRAQLTLMRAAPVARAAGTGLLSGILPCGWLYAFVGTAAGTGSPGRGALVLLAFWLGTVPLLAGIGSGVRQALARSGRALQVATAVLVIGLGFISIVGRWSIVVPSALAAPGAPPPSSKHCACH
jgi:uncharacterized protein